jgi:hypothetical protein
MILNGTPYCSFFIAAIGRTQTHKGMTGDIEPGVREFKKLGGAGRRWPGCQLQNRLDEGFAAGRLVVVHLRKPRQVPH